MRLQPFGWEKKILCPFNTLEIFYQGGYNEIFYQGEYNFANWNLIERHLSFLIYCLSLLPLISLILGLSFSHNGMCVFF